MSRSQKEVEEYTEKHKEYVPYKINTGKKQKNRTAKLCETISEAVDRSGLKDGMTISFHHAFRTGDLVINMVMQVIAEKGIKNLTLASSSLNSCHTPLIEHIKNGVITSIYTSGIRGELGEAISAGLLEQPVNFHSHGGRVHLVESGEITIDVAFLGVPTTDAFGNCNAFEGNSKCGSLGYAKVDADHAKTVVLLTEQLVKYPLHPASITQDQVDYIVRVERIGIASKISQGATRLTTDPKALLIARRAADVIEHSGYFNEGFSFQTGTGAASLALTRFLAEKMTRKGIVADFALGGITGAIVDLHEKGFIRTLLDVQCFDGVAAESLKKNPTHIEISANQYANFHSKGAAVDRLDIVVLSALEIDKEFNVNVLTGSDGTIRGAIGGHPDTAASAKLTIIVAPLVRGRIATVVEEVGTRVTPGTSIDILITDQGIVVNPIREDLIDKLTSANIELVTMEWLLERTELLMGHSDPIHLGERIVGLVRSRSGAVIDVIHQIKLTETGPTKVEIP